MSEHLRLHSPEHSQIHEDTGTHPHPLDMGPSNSQTEDHNLDLEGAIGDAFKQFAFLNQDDTKDESELHHEQLQQSSENHDDSIDLEAAVGKAFLELTELMPHASTYDSGTQNEPSEHGKAQEIRQKSYEHQKENEHEIENPNQLLSEHSQQQGYENPDDQSNSHPAEEDIGLEAAVGNAFSSIEKEMMNHHNEAQNHESKVDGTQGSETEKVLHSTSFPIEDSEELDLEAAIGNAFKNISGDLQANDQNDVPQENGPAQTEKNTTYEAKHQNNQPNPDDNKLEDAIEQAFKALSKEFELNHGPKGSTETLTGEDDSILHEAIFASFNEIMGLEKRRQSVDLQNKTDTRNLAGVVKNVVQQMSLAQASGSHDMQITKDAIHDLAQEITNHAHGQELHKEPLRPKDIPHIDENVLAHFQMEANKKDDKHSEDNREDLEIKNVFASAVRNALQKGDDSTEPTGEKSEALEKLHMNDILQNAFNMAMLNPQELLTSIDLHEVDIGHSDSQNRENSLSTAAAIAALSVKEALSKQEEFKESSEPGSLDNNHTVSSQNKSLSIAETLALHRSSMSNVQKRDLTPSLAIEGTPRVDPQKMSAMNPQLSSILSSLSQHIQSGNQSQNLMMVIRQMTNALMLNKSSSYSMSSATLELLQEVRAHPNEQKFYIDSLNKARGFLSKEATSTVKRKALSLIENVIGLVRGKPEAQSMNVDPYTENEGNDDINSPILSQFYSSAFSTLSNFNNRFRSTLAGAKPNVDSNEYKERIRIENRERKKRWREENAERNKDNDLRSRVIKRATYMFGEGSTPEKKAWIEEEFNKRRAKRLAKQKKEEVEKPVDTRLFAESAGSDTKSALTIYAQDPKFVKRLSDFFKIVAESGNDEDPQALMTAASAATAVAATEYAHSHGISEGHPILDAMSQILTNVLDATVRSGNHNRISFLSKDPLFQSTTSATNTQSSELINRISSLSGIQGIELDNKRAAIDIIRDSRKRFGADFFSNDPKRPHTENTNTGGYVEKDKTTMSRIQYEIDQLRNSITTSTSGHIWGSSTGLKMPLYKKPTAPEDKAHDNIRAQVSTPSLPIVASPFISNKIGIKSDPATTSSISGGLRKPGSFQRPAFSRSTRGRNVEFPTLYSASFSQK